MFRARDAWVSLSKRIQFLQTRSFCSNNSKKPKQINNNGSGKPESEVQAYTREYNKALKDLENPDFFTALKVYLTFPRKNQKIGIDFHLVQFFFACLPPLALYQLVLYAQTEMRRVDEELAEKEKREQEIENEKNKEIDNEKNREIENSPAIVAVTERLGHLEEAVKEIGVEIKRLASNSTKKDQEDGDAEKQPATVDPSKTQVSSAAKNAFSGNNSAGSSEDSKNK